MPRIIALLAALGILLLLAEAAAAGEIFEPLILVYGGRNPGFAQALAEIVNETGTRALVVDADATLRSMVELPQVRCIVIAALNPSDFPFLRGFAPVLIKHFEEGGSLVGIGPCCSMDISQLATTIFPVRGNATGRGKSMGGTYGSEYVLSTRLEAITSKLPSSFVITQNKYAFRQGGGGPLDPSSREGQTKVIYREASTGAPMVVTLEGRGGGRSVSLPGCYVVNVERLPFYWGRLVEEKDFRELLKASVSWAMDGSERYSRLAPAEEATLAAEAERLEDIRAAGADYVRRTKRSRLLLLGTIWTIAILFQAYLVVRFIVPRVRMTGSGD